MFSSQITPCWNTCSCDRSNDRSLTTLAIWLAQIAKESFLLVIAEPACIAGRPDPNRIVIGGLRQRLGIKADRLQVISTTASFHDNEYAPFFGAQLTGKHTNDFRPIKGDLGLRKPEHVASPADAELLAGLDLIKLDSELASDRDEVLSGFCHAHGKAFDSAQWQLFTFRSIVWLSAVEPACEPDDETASACEKRWVRQYSRIPLPTSLPER